MGDCRGCFKQQLLPSPVQLLQMLPAPGMTTSPGMCGVPTQHSCTRAQPLPPQPQPAAAAEPALQPRAPGNGRRWLSQEGAIRKSKENPSWKSHCSSIFPASMSLLLAGPAVEPSVVLCGEALRQSITHSPHAHQHCLQLLLDQFGWLLKADFPKLPFPATLPFSCYSLPSRQHHMPRLGTVTLSSTGQGQPAHSRSHMGTGSNVKMKAGCLVKGWSPYSFGVTLDMGSLHGTAFPAQLPGKRNNTASRAHVLVTCVQLHSSQSKWRGARATGKETPLWDTEPPSQGPLTK